MKASNHFFISFMLFTYAFFAIFGLLAMNYIHMHTMSSMDHCPFMMGEQSVCAMNTSEHINAFNGSMQTTVGQLVLVVLPVLFSFLYYSFAHRVFSYG